MSDKRKILELDISTDEILRKSAELRKELEQLREKRKQLKKQDGDNSKELAKLDAGIKSVSSSYRQNQKALTSLYEGNEKFLSTEERLNLTLDKSITSVNSARQANKELLAIRNELNLKTEEGRKNRDVINQQLDKNNDFIKENVSELEKQKIGIGGYKDAINEAIQENGLFQGQMAGVTNIFQSFSPVLNQFKNDFHNITNEYREATTATEGMTTSQKILNKTNKGTIAGLKLLRLALIGTGIGAIVVLLGSLVAYLSSTQEGVDKVNRVLTPMKEIFSSLLGIIQDFGKEIFDALSNPKQLIKDVGNAIKENLINRFTALSKIANSFLDGDWAGVADGVAQAATGVENLSGKIKNAANNTKNFLETAIDRGKEIQRLQEEIERGQNALIVNESKYNKEIKAANKIAEDQTKTLAEREAAAKRSVDLSKQLLQEQQAILDKEIEQTRLKQEANDTSRADEAELNELIAKRNNLETAALELQTTQTNKLNTIRSQAQAQATKAANERIANANKEFEIKIKQQEDELRLFILQQEQKNQTQLQELDTAKKVSDQRKAIEKEKFEAGKISETEYQIALLEIKEEYNSKQVELALTVAEREKEAAKQKIENEVAVAQEKNNRLAEVEREYQQKRLEQGAIDQEEYNLLIDQINEENRIKNAELEEERRLFNQEIELEREEQTFLAKFERQKTRLEQERQLAVQEAKRLGADVNKVNDLYAEKEKQIDKAKNRAIIESRLETAKTIANILGEQSVAAKFVALAEAGYNLGVAISQANTVPFPANILAIAQATAAGVKAVKSINQVKEAKPEINLSTGGVLDDPRLPGTSTSDSIPANLSKGESVINAKSTKMFRPILSAINAAGGGVNFNRGGIAGVSSAFRQLNKTPEINYDLLAVKIGQQVGNANRQLPAPNLNLEEFDAAQSTKVTIESRANHE